MQDLISTRVISHFRSFSISAIGRNCSQHRAHSWARCDRSPCRPARVRSPTEKHWPFFDHCVAQSSAKTVSVLTLWGVCRRRFCSGMPLSGSVSDDRKDLAEQIFMEGEVLEESGKYRMAQAKFEEALSLLEQPRTQDEARLQYEEHGYAWHSPEALKASVHERLGTVLAGLGAYDDALGHSDEAMRILKEVSAREVDEDGWNAYRLACGEESRGVVLYRMARLEEGLDMLEGSIVAKRKYLGARCAELGVGLMHIGNVLVSMGRYSEAEMTYQEAMAAVAADEADGHELEMLRLEEAMGNLAYLRGQLGEAASRWHAVLRGKIEELGEEHTEVAGTLVNLASALSTAHDHATALRYLSMAHDILLLNLGPDNARVAATLNNIAAVHLSLSRYPEAIEAVTSAIQAQERVAGPADLTASQMKATLASIIQESRDGKAMERRRQKQTEGLEKLKRMAEQLDSAAQGDLPAHDSSAAKTQGKQKSERQDGSAAKAQKAPQGEPGGWVGKLKPRRVVKRPLRTVPPPPGQV